MISIIYLASENVHNQLNCYFGAEKSTASTPRNIEFKYLCQPNLVLFHRIFIFWDIKMGPSRSSMESFLKMPSQTEFLISILIMILQRRFLFEYYVQKYLYHNNLQSSLVMAIYFSLSNGIYIMTKPRHCCTSTIKQNLGKRASFWSISQNLGMSNGNVRNPGSRPG